MLRAHTAALPEDLTSVDPNIVKCIQPSHRVNIIPGIKLPSDMSRMSEAHWKDGPSSRDDSLGNADFFTAPLTTLIQSLEENNEVNTHDLIEAYHVLQGRIKTTACRMARQTQTANAFQELSQHAKPLARALKRDVALAIPNETLEESVQRDLASLSSIAARVLADLFSIPALCAQLSELALSKLMSTVIRVLRAPTSTQPVKAFFLWILQRQRLPPSSIIMHRSSICEVLTDTIKQVEHPDLVITALKTLHNLLRSHPVEFFVLYKDITRPILGLLVSQNSDLRFHAIQALSSIALAKAETVHLAENEFYDLSILMKTFMDVQGQHKPPPGQDIKFEDMLLLDLKDASRVPWVMTTLACLIVLTDSYLFSHPRTIRFIRNVLQACRQGPTRAAPPLQIIHACVLKCLIWAFSRIPSGCRGQSLRVEGSDGLKEKAFLFVNNDTLAGVPTAIVIALQTEIRGHVLDALEDFGFSPMHHLIEKVSSLMRKPPRSRLFKEAAKLLLKLIRTTERETSTDVMVRADILIKRSLLDNTVLYATKDNMGNVVGSMNDTDIDYVRPLKEEDVVDNWDELMSSWSLLAQATSRGEVDFEDELFDSWHTLLLVQRAQGVPSSVIGERICTSMVSFITGEGRSLEILLRIWTSAKSLFDSAWWERRATVILDGLLSLNTEKTEAWSALVEQLHKYSTDVQQLRDVVLSERKLTTQVRAIVWSYVVNRLIQSPPAHWTDKDLQFCLIPAGKWGMKPGEREAWGTLLDLVLPETNVDEILETGYWNGLSAFPAESYVLLSRLPTSTSMIPVIVSILEGISTSDPTLSLDYLQLLRKIIAGGTSRDLENIQTLCCRWIGNEDKLLSPHEYNTKVIPLYKTCLSLLDAEAATGITVLDRFNELITSIFHYSPPPALGPMAFEEFWNKHFRDRPNIAEDCPGEMKQYLQAFDHAYQGNLTAGFPESIDSQFTGNGTIIPDSQTSTGHVQIPMSAVSSRAGTVSPSPVATNTHTVHPKPSSALKQLQDYASQAEDASAEVSEDEAESQSTAQAIPRREKPKRVFDGVVITRTRTTRSSGSSRRAQESQLWTPEPSMGSPSRADEGDEDEDDYDTWEQGVSADDVAVLQGDVRH